MKANLGNNKYINNLKREGNENAKNDLQDPDNITQLFSGSKVN
jgi:hypothetical protein